MACGGRALSADSCTQGLDPEELAQTQRSAAAWSRLVRAPRARTKHVILDVCSAHVDELGPDTSRGMLVRQVSSLGVAALQTTEVALMWQRLMAPALSWCLIAGKHG